MAGLPAARLFPYAQSCDSMCTKTLRARHLERCRKGQGVIGVSMTQGKGRIERAECSRPARGERIHLRYAYYRYINPLGLVSKRSGVSSKTLHCSGVVSLAEEVTTLD
jgi:hypothetical protein